MNRLMPYLSKITGLFRRYATIVCIVIFGAMYGYLVYTASQQAELEPSDSDIDAAYTSKSSPKPDDNVVKQLERLEDSSVEVKSIIDKARQNPFNE